MARLTDGHLILAVRFVMVAALAGGFVMTTQTYTRLAASIFAIIAVLQLVRAVLGWPITVEMGGGPMSLPTWPSWIAFVVLALLAWQGFSARPD